MKCPTCTTPMVASLDALQRARFRCPVCERLARPRVLRPGEIVCQQVVPVGEK